MTTAWTGSAARAATTSQRGDAPPMVHRRAARKPDANSASRSRKPSNNAGASGSMPMIAFSERRYLLDDANRNTRIGVAARSTRLLGRIRFTLACCPLAPARGRHAAAGAGKSGRGTGRSVAPVLGDQLVEGTVFLDRRETLVEGVDHGIAFLEHDAERIGLQSGDPDGELAREFLLVRYTTRIAASLPAATRNPRRDQEGTDVKFCHVGNVGVPRSVRTRLDRVATAGAAKSLYWDWKYAMCGYCWMTGTRGGVPQPWDRR